jgi:hypothetical protein
MKRTGEVRAWDMMQVMLRPKHLATKMRKPMRTRKVLKVLKVLKVMKMKRLMRMKLLQVTLLVVCMVLPSTRAVKQSIGKQEDA